MKIERNQNVVELIPENDEETADLEDLWRNVVDCAAGSKKLSPIGEYIPQKKNSAQFYIEDPGKN